jgi:DNA-binding GntR family transcriptional regulator
MAKTQPDLVIPPTRAGVVTDRLRQLIQSGEMRPGTRLRQTEIAERFGVSTTPVREAFVTLARAGLVRQDARRGVVVFSPSIGELSEIYELRVTLEPILTKIAAENLVVAELDEISVVAHKMSDAGPEEYATLNRELHAMIYRAAHRPRMVDMVETLREAAAGYLALLVHRYDQRYRDQVQREHEEIIDALRTGTPAKAAQSMRRHLKHNAAHVRSLIDG